jgi:uncharacterized protein YgiM (DUF1202 family)
MKTVSDNEMKGGNIMANPKRWPIGLQSSTTGKPTGIGEVIQELTRNNIAFFSASTDAFSILSDLQNAREAHPEVPHTANFCLTGYWPEDESQPNRYHFNVPEYTKAPSEEVARRHWDMVEKRVPIHDPQRSPIKWHVPCIWISTWNEIADYVGWFKKDDPKQEPVNPVAGFAGNADLIGHHAVEVGKEAVRRGYRWAAFGFAGGNPEEGFWDAPGVLAYLRLCEKHPDQLGVALHEYSLADTILNRPDHIGRFKQLHDACDRHGIRRPVIQFKEFGWRDIKIPDNPDVAMQELIEVAKMYMEHPNIHGAAIWTVQPWQGSGIHHQVVGLIPRLRDAALQHARPIGDLKTPAKPAEKPAVAQPPPVVMAATGPAAPAAGTWIGHVNAPAGLNLRREPSTAGKDETIEVWLPPGTAVEIIARIGDWYQANALGKTGYVFAEYITQGTQPPQPVVASTTAATGAAAGATRSRFQPGMNINIGVHGPDVERLRGLSWVRFVFIAADRQRSIDDAFNQTYGPLIREYADAGIKSLIILNHETEHGNTPWQSENGDWATYANHFGRAARRVAELCAPFDDQAAFQIWNEQDSGWSADKGNPNPSARGVLPEDFALTLDAAARNIREVAPRATIVAGGLKTGAHNGVAYLNVARGRLGGRLPVDAIACHPYGRWVSGPVFEGWGFGPLSETLSVYRNSFPNLPLWITEVGIPGHKNKLGPEHYDKIGRYLNELVSEVANKHASHVPVLIWFAWTDRMENAGILTDDNREKPGIFEAFQAMKARGAVMAGALEALEKSIESALEAGPAPEIGIVTAPAGLNLRTEPSTAGGDATIKTRLLDGTQVAILERHDGWYKVQAGELDGFVSAEFIRLVPPQEQPGIAATSTAKPGRKTRSVIGIHGAPGHGAPPRHMWDRWIGYMQDMGVRWFKQCETSDGTGDGSIFQWVLHLKRNGIEPIVRYQMSSQFPNHLEEKHFRQMQRYAQEDIHWAEIGNEPNLGYEWVSEWQGRYEGNWPHGQWIEQPRMRWTNPESIETLARLWVEDATRAADMGAWPAFYAFGPTDWGQHRPDFLYSSTMFTDKVVERLATHHREQTIRLFRDRQAWIAVHVAKYEKDLDYNPYGENPNKPWDMALRGYEVVLNAFRRHFGGSLRLNDIPIISTEGGVFVPDHSNHGVQAFRLPPNDEEHARQTVEMFRYVENHTPLTAMCPWCISEGDLIGWRTDMFRHHGWFKEDGGQLHERPVLEHMRRLRRESEKSVSLEELAAEGLEAIPTAEAESSAVTVTITVQIKLPGGVEAQDIVVKVNPEGE